MEKIPWDLRGANASEETEAQQINRLNTLILFQIQAFNAKKKADQSTTDAIFDRSVAMKAIKISLCAY
jgi:hypothetical protein